MLTKVAHKRALQINQSMRNCVAKWGMGGEGVDEGKDTGNATHA